MKVALLICDRVSEEFARDHGDYSQMFHSLLASINMDDHYVIDGQFPNINDYDAYVITGSRYGVYDQMKWIEDLKVFTNDIFTNGKKCVGICFGHQMIAESLGGKVLKTKQGYMIGLHEFTIVKKEQWMDPFVPRFNALMLCQDQVKQLPPNAKILAATEGCPVAMFSVGDHFLGIQGHPEFTKDYNQAIFESRREIIGESKIRVAIDSFKKDPDSTLLKKYIFNFLNA